MRKVFSIACLALVLQAASAQGIQGGLEDGVAITFFPIDAKAHKLVAVELVTSTQYKERYLALEMTVMKNDWRPMFSVGSEQTNPGKCTVKVLPDWYVVDCWLTQTAQNNKKAFAQYDKVKTIAEVIASVNDFSKNRTKK